MDLDFDWALDFPAMDLRSLKLRQKLTRMFWRKTLNRHQVIMSLAKNS